jgi:hypothetical protein
MGKDYLFDDYEDEDDDEFYDKRARGKELRKRKEHRKSERQEQAWSHERSTREATRN